MFSKNFEASCNSAEMFQLVIILLLLWGPKPVIMICLCMYVCVGGWDQWVHDFVEIKVQ